VTTSMTDRRPQPRRLGFKRWIILALVILGGVLAWGVGSIFTPTSPAVVIPGEPALPGLPYPPAFTLTNTMVGTLLADLVLILIALGAFRFVNSGQLVPRGFYNLFESILEWLWNSTEAASGRWARRIFPFVATIFLLVLTANLVKLTPIFESIGYLKEAHGNIQGYAPVALIPGVLYTIDGSHPVDHADDDHGSLGAGMLAAAEPHGAAAPAAVDAPCHACEVVPTFRGAATDLNFTFALAVVAVVMTQVFGLWALGPGYLTRFFNFAGLIRKPGMGVIDFAVGVLELISEASKVLSFSFRLFGNIFAGTLLLSILGTLTVIVLPVGIYIFELFFGTIQAYVFAMLALVFMSQATVSHHDGGGDGHGAEAHASAGGH
jgi:F-type H+-transporting ATPase subunit a